MILFLTLCYIGVLALLVKLRVITLNLWWKLSPVLWVLLLLILLFIPMQWVAPTGSVTMYQQVVEIIPNVSGEVSELVAQPNRPLKKGDPLFRLDARPYQYRVDQFQASLAQAEQEVPQLKAAYAAIVAAVDRAKAERRQAQLELERARRLLSTRSIAQQDYDVRKAALDKVVAAVQQQEAQREKAKFAYESQIEGVNTQVAQLQAQLKSAEYDLEQTVIRAPADGYVVGLTLAPGQRVSNLPLRGWMAFVVKHSRQLVAWINQNVARHVRPDAPAEITFKLRPGKVVNARVSAIVPMAGEGQLQASGLVPTRTLSPMPGSIAVVLELEGTLDGALERLAGDVPGGALGTVAIYTDSAKPAQIVRRIILRMEAWMNYLMP